MSTVIEIFSSVQGEGPLLGCRQIFIRFHGCNLHCAYCDTISSSVPPYCQVHIAPGQNIFKRMTNPMSVKDIAAAASAMDLELHHSVSLTGGEPLLYHSLILELAPLLGGTRHGIYLETNGTLPDALNEIIDVVDIIAMDFKLPSVTGQRPFWEEHCRFLKIASQKDTFIKVVVGDTTPIEEVEKAARIISNTAPDAVLIIQPVSKNVYAREISPANVLILQEKALKWLDDVRIIPQTHKIAGFL